MVLRKVVFTAQDEFQSAHVLYTPSAVREFVYFKTIQVELQDPSDLIMCIEKKRAFGSQVETVEIPLIDFRNNFLFQNKTYILDVSGIDQFLDYSNYFSLRVSFKCLEEVPISVAVYYQLIDRQDFLRHLASNKSAS